MGRSVFAAAGHKAGGPLGVGSLTTFTGIGRDPATGELINRCTSAPTASSSILTDLGTPAKKTVAGIALSALHHSTPAWWRHDAELPQLVLGRRAGALAVAGFKLHCGDPRQGRQRQTGRRGLRRIRSQAHPLEPVIPPDNFGFPKPGAAS